MTVADLTVRDAEIRALELLDHPLPDSLKRLVRVAAMITGAQAAELHVITSTTQHSLVSAWGVPKDASAEDSYCARILEEPTRTHIIPDTTVDPRTKDSPFTTEHGVRSYAASQLVSSHDIPVGTLCVFDAEHKAFDPAMVDAMAELAATAMEILEGLRHQEDLHETVTVLADGTSELRRSNEHLAAFAGQVSHDVQGPLAAVLMALQMLEEEVADRDEVAGMLLGTALSGAQRMRMTIAGLMDYAVLGGRLERAPIDMNAVAVDVLADLTARRGRAEVVVGDLPKVYGDDVQIRAVTQNLLANALKYAGHVSHPVIRLTGENLGDRTRISVADNGPGVPAEQREGIFGLMVRGDRPEHAEVDGLGIGLATCRRIVQAHGGTIGVGESADGGADFWFEIPTQENG